MDGTTVTPVTTAGQAQLLRLSGHLDTVTARECAVDLLEASTHLPATSLILLDLRTLQTLSADGIRVLTEFVDANTARDIITCAVGDPDGAARRALRVSCAAEALPVYATPEQAIADHDGHATGPAASRSAHEVDAALSAEFETLTRALLVATTVGEVLGLVITAALTLLPDAELASVTLRNPDGAFSTPAETEELGSELDQVQYRSGQGPCVDAARPEGPAYAASDDLGVEQRWPDFAAAAHAHGLGAVLSVELLPVAGPAQPSGALNIYARKPHGLTDTDHTTALLLATHAALALAHSHTRELAELHQAQLRTAIETRDVIGQAKGILMARRGLSADEAFDLLRRTSQDLNVKLVELAETLATHHASLDLPGAGRG